MSDQNPIKVHIEGWRRINHSYALVNRHQLRWMLRDARLSITHREMPYFKSHWQANPIGSFPAVFEEALTLPDQDAPSDVDITLRMDFPHRFDMPAKGKLVVFGTTEYTQISSENLRGDVAAAAANPKVFILTPSQWSAKGFLKLGFPQERIWVLPHGVDREHFRPTSSEEKLKYRAQLGIDAHAQVFLHVGGGWFGKGLDILIEAFSIHAKTHPNSRLVIKGHDALYGNAVRNAFANRPLALPPGVELATEQILYLGGDLNDQAMDQLYRLSDCYVATYRGEGFNMPLLEAAARGIVTIATKGGSSDDFLPMFNKARLVNSRIDPLPDGNQFLNPSRTKLIEVLNEVAELDNTNTTISVHSASQNNEIYFTWENIANKLTGRIVSTNFSESTAKTPAVDNNQTNVIFVHLGSGRPRLHFIDVIEAASKHHEGATIWLVLEPEHQNYIESALPTELNHRVKTKITTELPRHPLHKQYLDSTIFNAKESEFWLYSTERFFYLLDLIVEENLISSLHVESDVLVFANILKLIERNRGTQTTLFPLDRTRGFGSTIYLHDVHAVESLCKFIVKQPAMNDMELLGRYYNVSNRELVGNLPTIHTTLTEGSNEFVDRYLRPTQEDWGLFDAAAFGQYLLGVDPIHDGFSTLRFKNENSELSTCLDNVKLIIRNYQIFIETAENDIPVNTIHVHSKLTCKLKNPIHSNMDSVFKGIYSSEQLSKFSTCLVAISPAAHLNNKLTEDSRRIIYLSDFHVEQSTKFRKNIFAKVEEHRRIEVDWLAFNFFTKLILPNINKSVSIILRDPHLVDNGIIESALALRTLDDLYMPSAAFINPKVKIIGDPSVSDSLIDAGFSVDAIRDKSQELIYPIPELRIVELLDDSESERKSLHDYYSRQANAMFSVIPENLDPKILIRHATESVIFKTKLVTPQSKNQENKLDHYRNLGVRQHLSKFDLVEYINFGYSK